MSQSRTQKGPATIAINSRQERVDESIAGIEAFHALGKSLLDETLHQSTYGTDYIRNKAESTGVNADTLRKARQFAQGYSKQDLLDLCNKIRKKQTRKRSRGPIFGVTHVIRLLSVQPAEDRAKMQSLAIQGAWSTADLERHIARRYERRRVGGRHPRIPSDTIDLLIQIEGMCESWRRWEMVLFGDTPIGKRKHPLLAAKDLSDLNAELTAASTTLRSLHRAVLDALANKQPRITRDEHSDQTSSLAKRRSRENSRA